MLKIYDTTHFIDIINDSSIRNLIRTDELDEIKYLSYLSFEVPCCKKFRELCALENYVVNYDGCYVIKEVYTTYDGWYHVECYPNIEAFTNILIHRFDFFEPSNNAITLKTFIDYVMSFVPSWTCNYIDNSDNFILRRNKLKVSDRSPLYALWRITRDNSFKFFYTFDTLNRVINIMNDQYFYASYNNHDNIIMCSNQTGISKMRLDKNSYNLYTEYILNDDVSPVLYPNYILDGRGYEFNNPVYANRKFTDKKIQKKVNISKITDKLTALLKDDANPIVSYVVSGSLLHMNKISVGQPIMIFDTVTNENIYTIIYKLEYNYITPEKSKIYLNSDYDTKINEQLEEEVNETSTWIQQFMEYIATAYPDELGHFYDPLTDEDLE